MDIKLSTIPRDKHESCWLYLNMMLNFDVRIFYCIDVINWSHGSSYMYPAWSVLHLQLHVHVKGPIQSPTHRDSLAYGWEEVSILVNNHIACFCVSGIKVRTYSF